MAISVGSVEVDIVPNTRNIYARLREGLVPAATRAGDDAGSAAGRSFGPAMQRQVGDIGLRIGEEIGQQIANRITASLRDAIRDGVTRGGQAARPAATKQGEETGGAFARSMKARLEAAFKSLPKANVSLDDTGVDADLARLRARMETLSGKRIGIDVDVAAAQAEIADIEERLRRLGAAHPNVSVRADTAAARAQLAEMQAELTRLSADPHRIRLETDGSFGTRLRAAVQAAEASLPNINIDANTSPAQAEIASLRAQLTALRDVRIGVDMDAATAAAKITDIQARLERLSASDADVAVRVDAAGAVAQLAAVQAMVDALNGKRAEINISHRQAMRAILQLSIAIAGLATIPAVPVLAAGIGAIASAATVAAVGVGALGAVAAPAIIGIAGALQAQKAAQDAASTASIKGAQATGQGAAKALQMAGAQQALAAAHRNAARSIGQAEQSVADAVRQSAEANRTAAAQVRAARQAVADAVQQAADRQAAADDRVVQAEQSLSDAQVSARQAQQDLTQARRDAVMQLEDLSNRLADAQLSERDASLAVEKARQRLMVVRQAGDRASLLTQQEAQLAYDQAVQRLKEQRLETTRTAVEKKAADKAGVEGSDTVRSAQERLAASQRNVRDQQAGLAKAQQEAARTQVQGARDIAAAQDKVAEAQRNVARVQEDGARSVARAQESLVAAQQSAADSIASAQRQIASASQTAAGGVDQAAVAQAKYQAALAKLTPAARGTFNAFVSLRSAFKAWSEALQPKVMPLFTRAIIGLKNSLPGLTPLVAAAAKGIGDLQDRASAGFKKPWWQEFKKDLAGSIRPAIVGLGVAFGNIFKGMAGIIQAFLPHMDSISTRMQDITARFATWGTGLKGSPAFERFLAYAAERGPLVARTIGDISSALYQTAKALEPLSGPLLEVLGAVARAVASVAETLPWLIQALYLAYVATRLWTFALIIFNAVVDANPITLLVLGIIALIAAVIYAYKHVTWFRVAVDAAWSGIRTAASATWAFLQPVFMAFAAAFRAVGAAASWLWVTVLAPVFKAIGIAAATLIAIVLTTLIAPLVLAFRLVAATVTWLWQVAVGPALRAIGGLATWVYKSQIAPAFHGIAAVIRWLYNSVVVPVFTLIAKAMRAIGAVVFWLWTKAFAPALSGIGAAARILYNKAISPVFGQINRVIGVTWRTGIRPVFDAMKTAIGRVADAFRDARDAIGRAWDQIKKKTKDPINWVFKHVWNEGIVSIWKKIAGWVPGVPSLGKLPMLAAGGPMPMQPTMLNRPTAIVGEGNPRWPEYVIPTDPKYRGRAQALHQQAGMQLMASGGILGDIGDVIKASGGAAWDLFTGKATGADKLYKNPKGVVGGLLDPVLGLGKDLNKTSWGKMALGLPKMAVKALKSMAVSLVNSSGGDSPAVKGALAWARSQAGKPYQWGGAGNPSWDCSGFMSGIQKKILGQNPKGRLWSTFSFQGSRAPRGWKRHERSPFMVGITNSGKGHTAGTLAGVNVESRGGDGVVVGNRARGYTDPLFGGNWYGFLPARGGVASGGTSASAAKATARQMLGEFGFSQKQFPALERLWQGESGWRYNAKNPSSGAYGIPQSLPASKMASAGADWKTNPATQIKWGLKYIKSRYGSPGRAYSTWAGRHPHWYDQGGYLQPGLNLAYNGTGRPEPVFTSAQANALTSRAADPATGLGDLQVQVFVGDREIADIARAEVRRSNGELLSTLRAGRTGV